MRRVLAVAVGKSLRYLLRLVRRGGGSALPGLVASKIDSSLLRSALASLPEGVVVVSGSAGKSSTTHYLVKLLQQHGLRVFTNPSTANIRQGLFAAVLKESDLRARLDFDIAVLELDEGHGALLSAELEIRIAVFTNVYSDQLDRFVDPELVAEKLSIISSAARAVIVNSDDKNLCQFAAKHPNVKGYGLDSESMGGLRLPSYALNFGEHPSIHRLVTVSNSGALQLNLGSDSYQTAQQSPELALNLAAALLCAAEIVKLDFQISSEILGSGSGVFARNEVASILGKQVNLRLVQNPTSFQLNVNELTGEESPLMLMAGRDIHDPSWLWTVDFSSIKRVDLVSGFNAAELALRLKVAGVEVGRVEPSISLATEAFVSHPGEQATILFSADAMRRFRRHTKVAK